MGRWRPTIVVTAGDPNGIGPEIVLKAARSGALTARARLRIVGSRRVLEKWSEHLGLAAPGRALVEDVGGGEGLPEIGEISGAAGDHAMQCVERACKLCLAGEADAMVTAPISKQAIQLAGYQFPGHTEFLAQATGSDDFMMLMVAGGLRVGLLTVHEPLAQVPRLITSERVRARLVGLHAALRSDFGIAEPRIAVLGLNPHAGEGGVIGREEIEAIEPALHEARAEGINANGPFPADAFFGRRTDQRFDAVLAMYHDQGLAPFKALAMGMGVNVTCGLPIVRTSPDHGTAFDIAGSGRASENSLKEAVRVAVNIARRRRAEHALASDPDYAA